MQTDRDRPPLHKSAAPGQADGDSRTGSGTRRVAGNVLALGSSEIIARALAFAATAYLARALGPAGFGIVGFAMAMSGYFSLAMHRGFLDIGSREVARNPQDASAIAVSATVARLALALLAFAGILAAAWFLDKPPVVKMAVVLAGLSTFALALDPSWVHKGLQRNRPVGAALIFGQATYVAVVFLAVRGPDDVLIATLAQALGEVSMAALLAVSVIRMGLLRPDLRRGFRLLRQSAFPTVSLLLRSLIFTFDVVMLGLLLGETEVGLYSAPYRVCFLLLAVSIAVRVSYLPVVTRAVDEGLSRVREVAGRAVEFASAIGTPAVVGGAVLAAPILGALFGDEYREGATAFRLLLLSLGFIFVFGTVHNVLVACDRLRTETAIIGSAAALNVALNLVLIPRYGIDGAAVTTALSEGFILAAGLTVIYRMGVRLDLRPVLRSLLPAAVMGAVLLAVGPERLWLAASVILGGVAYAVGMVVFRAVPADLWLHLAPLADRLRGGFQRV